MSNDSKERRNKSHGIIINLNKKCLKDWIEINLVPDNNNFLILTQDPEKLDRYKSCRNYLKDHYEKELNEWDSVIDQINEFNDKNEIKRKDVLNLLSTKLESNFQDFHDKTDPQRNYYIFNNFLKAVYDYQRHREKIISFITISDSTYSNQSGKYKLIQYNTTTMPEGGYNLVYFNIDNMDAESIREKCIEIIKSNVYNSLIFDEEINEIKNYYYSMLQNLGTISKRIDDNTEIIIDGWEPQYK